MQSDLLGRMVGGDVKEPVDFLKHVIFRKIKWVISGKPRHTRPKSVATQIEVHSPRPISTKSKNMEGQHSFLLVNLVSGMNA